MNGEGASRRLYRTAPIQEALGEFLFEAGAQPWDATVPGRFAEALPDRYGGPVEDRPQVGTTVQHRGNRLDAHFALTPRASFQTPEGNRLALVGPHRCSAHALPPYPGWAEFRPEIEAVLAAYDRAVAPKGVKRVGLRYINRIVIPDPEVDLARYFRILAVHPPGLPDSASEILVRLRIGYGQGVGLSLTLASVADEDPHGSTFLLDLDMVWEPEDGMPVPIPGAIERVEHLHELEGDAFEACITDETRKVFDA